MLSIGLCLIGINYMNRPNRDWTEREAFSAAHRHVRLHFHPRKPSAQRLCCHAQVFLLGCKAAVRLPAEEMGIVSASIMSEQNDALELVSLNQELQLVASGG